MAQMPRNIHIRNPLSIIALFVFFIEAVATVSLKFVAQQADFAKPLIWFIILYPSVIALLFFVVLWFKREILFGPMDFRKDETFSSLLRKFEKLEIRQDAVEISTGPTSTTDVFKTIDRLLSTEDFAAAISVGRTYLKSRDYDTSLQIFRYLDENVDKTHDHYYRVLANIAYSLIGKQEYDKATDYLLRVQNITDGNAFYAWHALALAYCYFKLGKFDEYHRWLNDSKARAEYKMNIRFFKGLYPEIAKDLDSRASKTLAPT